MSATIGEHEVVDRDGLPVSVGEKADSMGLSSYDTSLPDRFFKAVYQKTGFNPYGEFVWCYDGSLLGYPVPLTLRARRWLGSFGSARAISETNGP